jgi:hypothetical protein
MALCRSVLEFIRAATGGFNLLALTDSAFEVIRALTDGAGTTPTAGLRLANDPAVELTASLVPAPLAGDRVLAKSCARVFVDSDLADMLDDKALDAAVVRDGSVEFARWPCGRDARGADPTGVVQPDG